VDEWTSGRVDEWKKGVNTLRLSTYAELLKIAAEKAYGKAWVEAFFRVESADRVSEDAPEPPPADGAGSSGGEAGGSNG